MKNITTFESACKALAISDKLPNVKNLDEISQKAVISFYKLQVISRALNKVGEKGTGKKEWKPDWNDQNQYKYYPCFYMDDHKASSGVGFSFVGYANVSGASRSCVGPRLCFKSSRLVEYAGKQFIDLYEDFLQ
jgi:hypothetical protein